MPAIGQIDKPVLDSLVSLLLLSAGGRYRDSAQGTVQIIALEKKILCEIHTYTYAESVAFRKLTQNKYFICPVKLTRHDL